MSPPPMNFVRQFKADSLVQKLRSAREMAPEDVRRVQAELVAMGPSIIPAILRTLAHGEARGPALTVLEQLASSETTDVLLEALASPNPAVSSGIAQILTRNRQIDPNRLPPLLSNSRPTKSILEPVLAAHLDRIPARRFLDVFPQLEKDGQAVVFRLLEKIEDPALVPEFMKLLTHEDWWVRMNATRLLGNHPAPEVVVALSRRLQDAHKSVRHDAVFALRQLRARSAVPDLIAGLRDPDYKVQTAVIDTLCELADASAVPSLLEVLTDESEYVRRGAVEVLNAVATVEAVQDLVRALRDRDWWVRVRAADALGALGGDKVVEAVMGLLHDDDDFIRRHAVEILNAVPSARAVDALIAALDDSDWWVRERAIDALGKSKDARAVDPLLDILATNLDAAPLCMRALAELGDERAVEPLVLLVESDREDIRREAAAGLKALLAAGLPAEARARAQSVLNRLHRPSGSDSAPSIPLPVAHRLRSYADEPSTPSRYRESGPAPAPAPARTLSPPSSPGRLAPSPVAVTALDYTRLEPETVLLERYRVRRKIGKGGFGAVYLVEDLAIQEDVILKILNPQLSTDEATLRRFVRELRLTRRITHRNVIRLHDFLNLGGAHAVSMEYFPSRDLGRILSEDGPLGARRSLHIVQQVCSGLKAAHAEGVIHRDLKPANVLVGENDEARIVDFGLASGQQFNESRLTKSGLLIGTPEYMAPEQISGGEVGARADIYSLGIVLYEMLSGRRPFSADTPVRILFLHLEGEAEPLRSLVPELPESLEHLVADAMARDPEHRPESVEHLSYRVAEELDALGDGF